MTPLPGEKVIVSFASTTSPMAVNQLGSSAVIWGRQ